MKKILPLLLIIVLALCSCAEAMGTPAENTDSDNEIPQVSSNPAVAENPSGQYDEYKVIRVVDGDTIVIDYEGSHEKLRIIGVDTPESVHPDKSKNTAFGKTVSDFSKSQLDGKSVGVEFDVQERDQYGRLLAYIYVGDQMYNKTLLEMGYASVATFPPNVKYVDEFTAIQKAARQSGVGMWSEQYDMEKATSSNTSNVYRGHNKNKKFHGETCRYGDMISDENLTLFKSRNEAMDAGYAACKVCNP